MTTFTDFTPSASAPFQFQPTFDGATYTVIVTWGLFGQRYYVNCYTVPGALVYSLPLIGSPPDYDISLNAGYFQSTLVYRAANNQFEVSP
jgi:hypothetical protein